MKTSLKLVLSKRVFECLWMNSTKVFRKKRNPGKIKLVFRLKSCSVLKAFATLANLTHTIQINRKFEFFLAKYRCFISKPFQTIGINDEFIYKLLVSCWYLWIIKCPEIYNFISHYEKYQIIKSFLSQYHNRVCIKIVGTFPFNLIV